MRIFALAAALLLSAQASFATFHLWQITKVYSNASGTVQYIEMFTTSPGQGFVSTHSLSSNSHSFTIPTDLVTSAGHDTDNQHLLFATPGYFALTGVPRADYNLGVNNFFGTSGDTIDWAGVNTLTFTAGQLPTDGVRQIERAFNGATLTTDTNSPTNFAGVTGTISAPTPTPTPTPTPIPTPTPTPTPAPASLLLLLLGLAGVIVYMAGRRFIRQG